jgi:DNA-binding CsgD family transcriptional regulator
MSRRSSAADPDVFRFRHGLTRDAVYAEPLEIERRAMHRQVFEAMRGMLDASSIGAIAHHAYAAQDAVAAAYFGELAGDNAAANRAAASACIFYERALAVAAPANAGRLSEKLARARLAAGFAELAAEPARHVLRERLRSNDIPGVLDAYVLLADIAAQSGADEARLATFEEMRRFLDTVADSSFEAFRALCESELAFADFDMDRVVAVTGGAAARGAREPHVAITLANARAHALLARREYRGAIASQTLAVRRAERAGDPDLRAAARMDLGIISLLSGDLERASRSFQTAATIAHEHFAATERALGLAMRSEAEVIRGNLALAQQLLLQALADTSASEHPGMMIAGGRAGIWLGLRADDRAFTHRVVDSLDLERSMFGKGAERLHPLAGAFARYLISTGRESEAHEILRRAIARLKSSKRYRITDWSFCSMLTVAEIGDPDDIPHARRPLAESSALVAPLFVNLFDAIVADRNGDPDAARRFAERTIEPFQRYGFAFEQVGALALAGRKAEALAAAERYGYNAIVKTLSEELLTRNRQGRSASDLTKRELAVARLVSERLTNRLIAERLCVSEKTVETHLASIFSKLGVSSRGEIGPALESGAVSRAGASPAPVYARRKRSG